MKNARRLLGVTALALMTAAPATADVLNFDDLGQGPAFFTSNYVGFMFGDNSVDTNPWFHTTEASTFYAPHSGSGYVATDYRLYDNSNPYQPTQAIRRSTAFVFDGAYFSGGDTIGYKLFLNNNVVYTSSPSATLTSTPVFVSSGYTGAVDAVVVYGPQGFYALDDFTFHAVGTSTPPVPEPATWAMMLLGFGIVAGAVRYRRIKGNVAFADRG